MSPVQPASRFSAHAPTAGIGIWRCPSCGKENTGELGHGCPLCGAGKPGQKVVEPPRAPTTLESSFFAWLQPLRGRVDQPTEMLLWEAFKAGYEMAGGERAPKDIPVTGTAETRTIRAALILFVDQVLQFNPEEVQTGELLSAADTQTIIDRYSH